MEARFAALTGESVNASDTFHCNRSVIVINLVELDWEDPVAVCQALLFTEVLGIEVTVTKAELLKSRNNKPGLIKCQLSSLTEKIVLRNKRNVADNGQTENVHIARMKSHEERLIQNNVKALLKEMPNGNNYKFTGSSRLVYKRTQNNDGDRNEGATDFGTAGGLAAGQNQRGSGRCAQNGHREAAADTESEDMTTRTTRGSVSDGRGRRCGNHSQQGNSGHGGQCGR